MPSSISSPFLCSIRTSQVLSKSTYPSQQQPEAAPQKAPKIQVFYAVVLHDFVAERADELDAKAGDPISVVAQSNREWFVAKPIGRLGRPGLIPVTFVEVRDPASNMPIQDIDALMDRGDLPRVEDWKRAMFNYKQSSIALGVLDEPNGRESVVPNSPYMPKSPTSPTEPQNDPSTFNPPPRTPSPTHFPVGILLAANVVSFHYEMEEYWFRIDATYQPYDPAIPTSIPPAKQLVLFRVYNDFYDFQVSLLNTFPREAGREPPAERVLPYMPGPATTVDDEITATRRGELDEYLHKLCELNQAGAIHILEHEVVREFLALKPGDVEHEVDPRIDDIEALYGFHDYPNSNNAHQYQDYESEVRDTLGNMALTGAEDEERSDASDYDDESYARSQQHHQPHRPSLGGESQHSLRQQAHTQNHHRVASSVSTYPGGSQGISSYQHNQPTDSYSPGPSRSNSPPQDNRTSGYSNRWPENGTSTTPTSSHSKTPSIAPSSRSRSHSNAGKINNPPISAANSQTAFVKIKIFDRLTDDLIALRVHPRVSHGELMDKVQARLGDAISHLWYRDSVDKQFIGLDGDHALSDWMDSTDKHVLYAD